MAASIFDDDPLEPDEPLARSAARPAPAPFLFEEGPGVGAGPPKQPPRQPRGRFGWSALLWRSAVVYAVLYCLPFPLGVDPWTGPLGEGWDDGKQKTIAWLSSATFGVEPTALPAVSGDSYYEVLFFAVAALLLGGPWHWLRRDHAPGPRARDVLRTFVRYYLAVQLVGYGLHKAIPLQFGVLDAAQLSSTYGQSSPMNLLWTFMASSPAYTSFVGLCEVLGGVLLLWRSTATFGALVAAGVMANVVMLNFCYDVPVKLFSAHLLLMAVLLCARDATRLLNVLVRNRTAEPAEPWPWSPSPWLRWPVGIAKHALVGWILFSGVEGSIQALHPLHGSPPLQEGTPKTGEGR